MSARTCAATRTRATHAGNSGLYGDARGGLVMDLDDFDETAHGPWEGA
ncbi:MULTISPECIES: DUF2252 family protein [Streptomyces]|nr:uncharacterized protein (DUF2252 family) [Streptomyces sp. DSM 41037]RPK90220.1 hypothetical protein EES47_09065 [Streptomyces sp. ADI98-12]